MREGRPQGETLRLDPHSPLPMHAQLEKILRQGLPRAFGRLRAGSPRKMN